MESEQQLSEMLFAQETLSDIDHDVFKLSAALQYDAFGFKVCQRAHQGCPFIGIVKYVPTCDCNGIHRGNFEHIIHPSVVDAIDDSRDRPLYRAHTVMTW